jgi:hypothetical protein
MTIRPLSIAALVAAALVVLTGVHASSHRAPKVEDAPPRVRQPAVDEAATPPGSRCAINHARFGGRRAQMYKVTKNGVANYVVMEIGSRRDPLMRFIRNDWLRMAYGQGAQRVWLGSFSSSEAAVAKAAELCPPPMRCLPGDEGCAVEARHETPAEVFSNQ